MKQNQGNTKKLPLDVAGSSTFGRYKKISDAKTFNMLLSDGWLVPFPGYKKRISIFDQGVGRRIYTSNRFGKMIAVIDNGVFVVNSNLTYSQVGTLDTYIGDVYIDENNAYQIGICDKQNIYIYNWSDNSFTKAGSPTPSSDLGFLPGYIAYHDTYFISPNIQGQDNASTWYLSASGNGKNWPIDSQHQGALQTKADYAIATARAPSRGNLILVFGNTVTEYWYNVGGQLFPYQRSTNSNVDYGLANAATLATSDNIVCWLGINEKSGPIIMYSTGGEAQPISTDGINFQLAQLNNPRKSFAFFTKQYGHLLYQITFYDPSDNITLVYDFQTQKFFHLTDENMNVHIAKNVAFFNNSYFFVSSIDGNIYEMDPELYTYDYGSGNVKEIPRVRVCSPIRQADSSYFNINNLTFTLEQGQDPQAHSTTRNIYLTTNAGVNITTNDGDPILLYEVRDQYIPRVDMRISKDGAQSFGSYVTKRLNPIGYRKNRIVYWRLGVANDLTIQLRFWSTNRVVASNGELEVNP